MAQTEAWEEHMQPTILRCGAVRLVPFNETDGQMVEELHRDPVASRFRVQPAPSTEEDAQALVRAAIQYEDDFGFSIWKVLSAGGLFLGWAGFAPIDETSEIGLDYCLSKRALAADDGLPHRLCRALSDWFFDNTYFSHLVAVVRTDNRDMREAVKDAGFYFRESKTVAGKPTDVFQMLSPSMQSYVLTA